jgi:hypothetical protein
LCASFGAWSWSGNEPTYPIASNVVSRRDGEAAGNKERAMRQDWIVMTAIALVGLSLASCQQAPSAPPTGQAAAATAAPATAPATATRAPADQAATAPPPTKAAPPVDVCSLLSAAEVSAIMGKTLVQSPHSCDYGLDPSTKQLALADAGVKDGNSDAENMASMMKTLSKGGPPGSTRSPAP